MIKKTALVVSALALVISTSSVSAETNEPIYDDEGNLIFDVEQEDYVDLTTDPEEVEQEDENEIELDPEPEESEEPQEPQEVEEEEEVPPVDEPEIPEVVAGYMLPGMATYMVGADLEIVTKGNMEIESVELRDGDGLQEGSWLVIGETIKFNKQLLDESDGGEYVFDVVFTNGTESSYQLKVVNTPLLEDYWQQNTQVFNKDQRSNNYKDLELLSSAESLELNSITFDGQTLPSHAYRIMDGAIIIGKEYLMTLESTDRIRINIMYSGGRYRDFPLEITDELEDPTSSEVIDC